MKVFTYFFYLQTSRLTWWTCKDEFSATDHLETNRDELDFVNQTFDDKIEKHHEDPQTPTMVDDGTNFFEVEMSDHSDGKHSYNLEKHNAVYKGKLVLSSLRHIRGVCPFVTQASVITHSFNERSVSRGVLECL